MTGGRPARIAESGRIRLRESVREDLGFILTAEADPENAPYIIRWNSDQHLAAIADADRAHWIVENPLRDAALGYVILSGLASVHGNVEFNRITIAEKNRGFGRECLRLVKRVIFERFGAHRLWLDVMTHNQRAHALYLSEGFVEEGCLRDALFLDGKRVSLVVLSMLRHEYEESLERNA